MFKQQLVFQPIKQDNALINSCKHYIKGCCFDPSKKLSGFVAVPCFSCLSLKK